LKWSKDKLSKLKDRFKGKAKPAAAGAAAGAAASGGDDDEDNKKKGSGSKSEFGAKNYNVDRPDSPAFKGRDVEGKVNPFDMVRSRQTNINFARQQNENLKTIKKIAEGTETKELNLVDGTVELSPTVATKIVETYNALNSDNKKVVQEMINSDRNSFMKFANFASGR
jgi:hypothetical protein